jgi:signal transduction histidine kinase
LNRLPPFASIFPGVEEAGLRQGLRALLAGEVPRFTHAYVAQTPLGPRMQQWEVTLFRVGAAVAALRRALREAVANRTRGQRQYILDMPDGEMRRVRVAPVRVGRRAHLLAFPDDLAGGAEEPPAERLLFAQEEERHRIAIELHDSTSQHLVAVSLGLARLRRFIGGGGRAERRVLEEMSRTLQAAIREIRTFSYLMNPPQLERDGLEATVRRFVAGFETRTGVKTNLTVSGAPDTAVVAVQHTLFRVLQEALTIVYRHAQAGRVEVTLASRGGWVTIAIADDGPAGAAGEEQLMRAPIGVGIAGMRAPVDQLGGALRVAHGPDGTMVTARLPVGSAASTSLPSRRRGGRQR